MNHVQIVNLLLKLDDNLFEEMKNILLEKYINFSIIDNEKVTKEILCEKLCDYIEKTIFKTNKSFEDLIKYYVDCFDELIGEHLEQIVIGENKKGKPIYEDSRAIKYFKEAKVRENDKKHPFIGLEDYSRISFCLYNEIIKNKRKNITDFNFSFDGIKIQTLINAIESEEVKGKKLFKLEKLNKRFQTTNKYSKDSFMLVMTIIMFYLLKNKEVKVN